MNQLTQDISVARFSPQLKRSFHDDQLSIELLAITLDQLPKPISRSQRARLAYVPEPPVVLPKRKKSLLQPLLRLVRPAVILTEGLLLLGLNDAHSLKRRRGLGRPVKAAILFIAALGLLNTCPVFANLGDSFLDANERWGLPDVEYDLPNGYKALYGSPGWVIAQIWDAQAVAVAVIYYKEWTGGTVTWITQEETSDLWLANTLGQGKVHWICSTDSTPQTMIWYSPDIPTIVHVELIPSGDHWTHCISFVASPAAANLLLEFKRAQD